MPINGISQTGLQGVQNGLRQAERAATEIARNGTSEDADNGNLAESAVDLLRAEQQVQASAEVIRTEDEVLGSLLDIRT